ncbi:helix-turn-helix transcriptional regulator [Paraburkholderia bryophila]|uniref:helix-turn-helix transcriptional regulator n=1 Tax=Paraburkholderia bryophila TaxID=420952 RepID=UPI0015C6DD3D|nr:AlpA family phage regulatory protein [Paraburkholderia bryophila]
MLIEFGLASGQAARATPGSPENSRTSDQELAKRSPNRPANAIIRRTEVENETGLSRSTIYPRIKAGTFPAPVKLGMRSVGWRVSDIETFLSAPADYRAATD